MLDLLGSGVDLLLTLFTTTEQAEFEVQGGELLNSEIGESELLIIKLFTYKLWCEQRKAGSVLKRYDRHAI